MTDSSIIDGMIIGLALFGLACFALGAWLQARLRVHRRATERQPIRFYAGYLLVDDKLVKALPEAVPLDLERVNQVGVEAATGECVKQLARLN